MAFTLQQVVPWGRSLDEYVRMFALSTAEKERRILGCGDGPASFNAEWTAAGGHVVSCDPLYLFTRGQIEQRLGEVRPVIMAQTRSHTEQFVWEYFASPDALEAERMAVAGRFLADYESGAAQGRYVAAALPQLPFESDSFPLAVCSHFLFLYSTQLSAEFHRAALTELLRVAREVRIFPLLGLDARPSPHLELMLREFNFDFEVEIVSVDYEFQRGGNQMLRLRHRVSA
jgi:hypothetical protein